MLHFLITGRIRLDVLVEAQDVCGVVFFLDLSEANVVRPRTPALTSSSLVWLLTNCLRVTSDIFTPIGTKEPPAAPCRASGASDDDWGRANTDLYNFSKRSLRFGGGGFEFL